MPAALLKGCSEPGCHELVERGRCANCSRSHERQRVVNRKATNGSCDYNSARWRQLRELFRRRLWGAGILPACGARLPGAPVPSESTCEPETMDDATHVQRFGERLHVHHILDHDGDEHLFTDFNNMSLLCRPDHSRETMRRGR